MKIAENITDTKYIAAIIITAITQKNRPAKIQTAKEKGKGDTTGENTEDGKYEFSYEEAESAIHNKDY